MAYVMAFLIVLSFVWILLSAYYRLAIRPILHRRAKYKVFALRDEVRRLAEKGEVDAQSFSFRHVEGMLNGMIRSCESYNAASLVSCTTSDDVKREIEKFDTEAPECLKEIERKSLHVMLNILASNSPWLAILFSLVVAASAIRYLLASRGYEVESRLNSYNRTYWSGSRPRMA